MGAELHIGEIYQIPKLQQIAIAPDGSEVAFFVAYNQMNLLYVMPTTESYPRLCYQTARPVDLLKWSPKGDWLAFNEEGISLWSLKKATKTVISDQPNHRFLNWASHGKSLLIAEQKEGREAIWVAAFDGSLRNRLHEVPGKVHSASWSPDGQSVLVIYEPYQDSKVVGELIQVESEESSILWEELMPFYAIPNVIWLADSKGVIITSCAPGYSKLCLVDVTHKKTFLTEGDGEDRGVILSKDGAMLAYSSQRPGSGDWEILAQQLGTKQAQPIVTTPGINTPLAWYPDGSGMFFLHEDSQTPPDLWQIDFEKNVQSRLTYSGYLGWPKKTAPPRCGHLNPAERKCYAQIYFPQDFQDTKRYPLILWLKDYPHTPNWNGFAPRYHWLASQGYVVVTLTYSGSTGMGTALMQNGLHDKLANGPLQDIQETAQVLKQAPYLHPTSWGIGGCGWGGSLALLAICHIPNTFRCVFAHGAITDWSLLPGKTLWNKYFYQMTGKWYVEDPDAFAMITPQLLVKQLQQLPVFLSHGKEDQIVPVEGTYRFSQALEAERIKNYTVFYDKEGHFLDNLCVYEDWHNRLLRFLHQNLMPWR